MRLSKSVNGNGSRHCGCGGLVVWTTGLCEDDAEQRFGTVHFETSCNETAQRRF